MATIYNGNAYGLSTSALPDMSLALCGLFQPLVFDVIVKTTVGYQVKETTTPITFRGVIQPFDARKLLLKPEGQRSWNWHQMHAEADLGLKVDDVVVYNGKQLRVMNIKEYDDYGYREYDLVQDYTGAGP